jgi:hypothetical protein
MESDPKDLNEIAETEIKEEDKKISDVPKETKQPYQKYYKSKSFMPKFTGKSIKSGASSFTNDSSLNNDPLSSSRDSEEKRIKRGIDIEYPTLKRSHSTKKYHYSKDYKKDIIKEEKNEDEDSFCSFASNRSKFSSYTIMPKESNLFFFEKRKFFDENAIKNITTMEPVLETYDENLIFQKPKMQLLSDKKEDSKLNVITSSNINIKKTPMDENEIIEEVKELDGIFDEEFDQRLDSIKIKYKSFYDKEEPPALFSGLQGECRPFNDEVPDEIIEENYEDDAKEVIRKNSMIIQRKKNIADEIDDDFKKIKRKNSKLNFVIDDKMFIDEKDELNHKDENEEKEEKDDKKEKEDEKEEKEEENEEEKEEKEDDSDKGSKHSSK